MAVSVVKSADIDYADIGDLIIYKIVIKNEGSTDVTSVRLVDKTPVEVVFIPDLVYIDGIKKTGVNPNSGIAIGTINSGSSVEVKFQVAVKDFFPYKNIENSCTVTYKEGTVSETVTSEILTTTLTKAYLNISKNGDTEVPLNGAIDYTIIVKNIGNTIGTNLIVRDILAGGLNLVKGSIKINGVTDIEGIDASKIIVGNIESGETKSIEFKASIGTTPAGTVLENVSDCFYRYTTNPDDVDGSYGTFYSNFINTKVLNLGIEILKVFDRTSIYPGEVGKCILEVRNSGASAISNINLIDPLDNLINFVAGSLNLDGIASGGNIEDGVNIGNLAKGEVKTVEFSFNALDVPTSTTITNIANANYIYNVNKQGETYSNEVELLIQEILYQVDANKISTPSTINSKENVIYTVTIKNKDSREIKDVILVDTVSSLMTVESIKINNAVYPMTDINLGIALGNLSGNETKTVEITGKTKWIENTTIVNNFGEVHFKDANNIARGLTTSIADLTIVGVTIPRNLEIIETSNKTAVRDGEEVVYEVTIKNKGDVDLKNAIYQIILGQNQNFVNGSLIVNGVVIPNGNITNINLGNILIGQTVSIQYTTKVVANEDSITSQNTYKLTYDYGIENNSGQTVGNGAEILIKGTKLPLHEVQIQKIGDKGYVAVGDELIYSVMIKNTGEVDLKNIVFTDTIAIGTEFIVGSLKKNNVTIDGNVEAGVNVGDLIVGANMTIEFKVKVLGK